MKIRLTEAQIKMLSELGTLDLNKANTGNAIIAATDPKNADNVNKLTAAVTKLKNAMKTENDDLGDEQPAIRMELEDHIDELIHSLYGFTYFKDKSKPEVSFDDPKAPSLFPHKRSAENVLFYPKMSPEQQASLDKQLGLSMTMLKSGDEEQLNNLFINLIRKKQSSNPIREEEDLSVKQYIDSFSTTDPNGVKLNDVIDAVNDFKGGLPASKLYRVLGGLAQKGKLLYSGSGKPIDINGLDNIMHANYLGRPNLKTRHIMHKTIPASGLNEGKMDFMIGKPIELKRIRHTIGKYNAATNAMDRIKRESIIKGVIREFTDERTSLMIVDYKTEQGSNGYLSVMYSKSNKEFLDANTSFRVTIEGLTPKDQRTLELFKANFYGDAINENNFADSEIFRIIAEAERPRLTKKDFIDYLKTKK